jgi:tetratricopeptide (TPR) repeat protein
VECLRVTEISVGMLGMRFPVDVSGGVTRFRHRRGELQHVEVEVHARELESWLASRLRGIVGTDRPEVWIGVRRGGATVCLASVTRPGESSDEQPAPVLVFDVGVVAEGDDLHIVVERARGSGLPATPSALAMACVGEAASALGRSLERRGSAFVVHAAARRLVTALWPEAGARAPSAGEVRWASFGDRGDVWVLRATRGAAPAPPDESALRALEIATLLRTGDDSLVTGDAASARSRYLEALERAPRHREILSRIVEIDATVPGRAEAALGLLADLRGEERARLGTIPGELLAETGDRDAAVASLERSAQLEDAPALSARALELAARGTADAGDAARLLDEALARWPRSISARWARLRRRLELARLEDALADAEHLEAQAKGPASKHAVWSRAGSAWHAAGFVEQAGSIFERALVYVPDEPEALAGLGSALVASGQAAQGALLLRRALARAEGLGKPDSAIRVTLARALAEHLDDLPAAVACAAGVAGDAPEAPIARGLEGRWRAKLGDLAGASLAFARLRELVAAFEPEEPRAGVAATLLREAAQTHRQRLGDVPGAKRLLDAALRLRPRDADLRREYQELNGRRGRDRSSPSGAFPAAEWASETHRTVLTQRSQPLDLALAGDSEESAEGAVRVEELTRQLQSDASNDGAAEELAELLERLGRSHELVALLFARLEDTTGERRSTLVARARETLERAAATAEERGRTDDAALLRGALGALAPA